MSIKVVPCTIIYTTTSSLYNLYCRQLQMPLRPPLSHPHDNSSLSSTPSHHQIANIYSFCQHYPDYLTHFINRTSQLSRSPSLHALDVIHQPQVLVELLQEIIQEGYVLLDALSEYGTRYRGWMSWMTIGFQHKGYIVDCLTFNKILPMLKDVLENSHIVKYCYRLTSFLEEAKRQWSAFGVNFFDFQLFEKSIGMKRYISPTLPDLSLHPLSSQLQDLLQQRYCYMTKYLSQLRHYLTPNSTPEFPIYAYSNHYQLLLKQHHHSVLSLNDLQKHQDMVRCQRRARANMDKENTSDNESSWQQVEYFQLKGERARGVCQLVLQWREHMAKIVDCPVEALLTFGQAVRIAMERPSSLLELEAIVGDNSSFSLQMYPKVLQILAYEAQMTDNMNNELFIKGGRKRQQKSIKNLLSELNWQGRQQWLNRRNDQSIKLYKQIVSIMQLDNSVVDEFMQGMNKGKDTVSKGDINRFIKYAEYMRNGNHRKLKEYYENNQPLQSGGDPQMQGWESDQQFSFIAGYSLSTSQTSIAQSAQKINYKAQDITRATLQSHLSHQSVSSHQSMSSVSDLGLLVKSQPLPQNIQEIYLKAVGVKKGYNKVQKKKGKKDSWQQEQIVPGWEDIQRLMDM